MAIEEHGINPMELTDNELERLGVRIIHDTTTYTVTYVFDTVKGTRAISDIDFYRKKMLAKYEGGGLWKLIEK